jgi:hypothetical protein
VATSQRLSHGLHRLAIILAAIPLLIGVFLAWTVFEETHDQHQKLLCAENVFKTDPDRIWESVFSSNSPDRTVELKEIGCSNNDWERVSVEEIESDQTWLSAFASALLPGVPIALILAIAIYLMVRAIGWVIGGGSIDIE